MPMATFLDYCLDCWFLVVFRGPIANDSPVSRVYQGRLEGWPWYRTAYRCFLPVFRLAIYPSADVRVKVQVKRELVYFFLLLAAAAAAWIAYTLVWLQSYWLLQKIIHLLPVLSSIYLLFWYYCTLFDTLRTTRSPGAFTVSSLKRQLRLRRCDVCRRKLCL